MSIVIGLGLVLFGILCMCSNQVGHGIAYASFGVLIAWVGFVGNRLDDTPKCKMTDEEKFQNAMGMQHEQMRNQEPLFKSNSTSNSDSSSIFDRDGKW